jgi:hypothetical protein
MAFYRVKFTFLPIFLKTEKGFGEEAFKAFTAVK